MKMYKFTKLTTKIDLQNEEYKTTKLRLSQVLKQPEASHFVGVVEAGVIEAGLAEASF